MYKKNYVQNLANTILKNVKKKIVLTLTNTILKNVPKIYFKTG